MARRPSRQALCPFAVLTAPWRRHSSAARYSVVTQAARIVFFDGSVAVQDHAGRWMVAIGGTQPADSEAAAFAASTAA